VPGYTVAGKTGTAQKPRTDGQAGYDPGKYVASFCGFLPAEDPRVLVLVVIDEPSGSYYYGSQVAAPVFSRIAGYCMEHLRVPPPARVTGPAHSGDD
jgi:cell division protein FtsI/penicillin-binding protein 2